VFCDVLLDPVEDPLGGGGNGCGALISSHGFRLHSNILQRDKNNEPFPLVK
jgi:hypothetical protein